MCLQDRSGICNAPLASRYSQSSPSHLQNRRRRHITSTIVGFHSDVIFTTFLARINISRHKFSAKSVYLPCNFPLEPFPAKNVSRQNAHSPISCEVFNSLQNVHSSHFYAKTKSFDGKTFWRERFGEKKRKMRIARIFPPKCFPAEIHISRQKQFSPQTSLSKTPTLVEVFIFPQNVYSSQILAEKHFGGKTFWRKKTSYVHFSYFPAKMFSRQNSWFWRENARYEHEHEQGHVLLLRGGREGQRRDGKSGIGKERRGQDGREEELGEGVE